LLDDIVFNLHENAVETFGYLHLLAVYTVDLITQVAPLVHVEAHWFNHRFEKLLLGLNCTLRENEVVTAFQDFFLHRRRVEY